MKLDPLQQAIIRTLLYFDIYEHPLNMAELQELIGISAGEKEFNKALAGIISEDLIGTESGYFFLKNNHLPIQERIKKLKRAEKFQKIAKFMSRIIYLHPFVRGVFITGSLSKSSISKKDDIDFLIITEPGKLWICRGFLMLFKKMFLFNSKKYFCINYFVDIENLEIPEKNIFTATELAFIKPLENDRLFSLFMISNDWIKEYFPNRSFSQETGKIKKNPLLKRVLESFLKGKHGEYLDNLFFSLYRKREKRKFGKMDDEDFEINFKSKKNVSKHHPGGYQIKIINDYNIKIAEFENKYGVSLKK